MYLGTHVQVRQRPTRHAARSDIEIGRWYAEQGVADLSTFASRRHCTNGLRYYPNGVYLGSSFRALYHRVVSLAATYFQISVLHTSVA